MNLLELIQANLDRFTKSEKNIAMYILNDPKEFARLDVETAVKEMKTSKPTLIRFAKKLGFVGYNEFRYAFASFLTTQYYGQNEQEDLLSLITKQYSHTILEIQDSLNDETMKELANLFINAPRITCYGYHRSNAPAKQLTNRAIRIGIDINESNLSDVFVGKIEASKDENDLFVVFSVKDNSKTSKNILQTAKNMNRTTILVTMKDLPHNSLATHCIKLPSPGAKYGQFIDEQAIFMVFTEILVAYIAKAKQGR